MRFSTLFLRVVIPALVASACTDRLPQAPRPERLVPDTGPQGKEASLTIYGEDFFPAVQISYREQSRSHLSTAFKAWLGAVELLEVVYRDSTTLTARVPAGLAPGGYDLTVEDPAGLRGTLPNAYTVLSVECTQDIHCAEACRSSNRCQDGACVPGPVDKDSDADGFIDAACSGGDDCDDDPGGCGQACHPGHVEECDGRDNDCDPATADGSGEAGWGAACDGRDSDLCPEGQMICAGSLPLLCDDDTADSMEACDSGVSDEDCDGLTDEEGAQGCVWYYRDADGDGHGVAGDSRCLCAPDVAADYDATLADDCDDGCEVCWTGHAEDCDGRDNDCEPATADGSGEAGWGAACDGRDSDLCPEGQKICAGSLPLLCDDDTADSMEACDSGVSDEDCDGLTDEEGAQGCAWYYRDADGDGHGVAGDSRCLCAPDAAAGYDATLADDCDDGCEVCWTRHAEDCDGWDNDCELATADGSGEAGWGAACDGTDSDLCPEGQRVCGGAPPLVCDDYTGDDLEGPSGDPSCSDGLDNDCDGAMDAADTGCGAIGCPWLGAGYTYRRRLSVENLSTGVVFAGYTATLAIDHAGLAAASKSRPDGDDLRIVYCDGTGGNVELSRTDESVYSTPEAAPSFGTASARISFMLVDDILSGAIDPNYFLYYGDLSAGAPPADPSLVYDFWEPFDDLSGWTVFGSPGQSVAGGILYLDSLATSGGEGVYLADPKGGRDSAVGFAVRARAMQASTNNEIAAVGWHLDVATGKRYDLSSSSSWSRIREWSAFQGNPSSLASDTGIKPEANRWYIYQANIDGQDFSFVRDGVPLLAGSDVTLSSGRIHLGGEVIPGRWDWLLIRLLVEPEPVVILGLEEHL